MSRSVAVVVALVLVLAVAGPVSAGKRQVGGNWVGLSASSYLPGGGADCTFAGMVNWLNFRDTDYTAQVELVRYDEAGGVGTVRAAFSASPVTGREGSWTSPDATMTATVSTSYIWAVRGSIWSVGRHPRMIASGSTGSASIYCE